MELQGNHEWPLPMPLPIRTRDRLLLLSRDQWLEDVMDPSTAVAEGPE
jgi:hypothetical protein